MDPNTRYLVGCSDERRVGVASTATLKLTETQGLMARRFGALTGEARVLAVATTAQTNSTKVIDAYSSFGEFLYTVDEDITEQTNTDPTIHTANRNELGDDPADLNADSPEPLGCAYAANIATVNELPVVSEPVRKTSLQNLTYVFGEAEATQLLDRVTDASVKVGKHFFTEQKAVSRKEAGSLNKPIIVLAGDHVPAEKTGVIGNLEPTQITNPNEAWDADQPFYNDDMIKVAEDLMRTYKQHQLDPHVLLATIIVDNVATRAALGGGDPTKLRFSFRGDPQKALAYLESVRQELVA
jgi:hypothetical protein